MLIVRAASLAFSSLLRLAHRAVDSVREYAMRWRLGREMESLAGISVTQIYELAVEGPRLSDQGGFANEGSTVPTATKIYYAISTAVQGRGAPRLIRS